MTADSEQWKPIPGFPGYEVSDRGRVRSYRKQVWNPGDSAYWVISDHPQRILRPSRNPCGYLGVNLMDEQGICHYKRIHWLVTLAFIGPCPSGQEICHNDGNPTNNTLANLRYDNHSANVQDAISAGVVYGLQTFTPEDILAIRHQRAAGMAIKELAAKYGCHSGTISAICLHYTYADLGGPMTSRNLPDYVVQEIYRRCTADEQSQRSIASELGVHESTVSRIVNGSRRANILTNKSKGDNK